MPFEKKIYLSSPTMHGEELKYITEAYETNWMSTIGANLNAIESEIAEYVGCRHAVALSSGTSALHLAIKYAGEKAYGPTIPGKGALRGHHVFCSDMTFDASVNPVVYECGTPVFIDTEPDTWNMSPEALERAFEQFPEVKIVVFAHLYGTTSRIDELIGTAHAHHAIVIEDAAESLGATYHGHQTGTFGDYNAISFNGNKIITGSSGGMFLTDDEDAAEKVRKWSTQSRDNAPWYQHSELGYNYRMSNVLAGVIRGQFPYLGEHIARKKAVYERYREGFKDLPVSMNPIGGDGVSPNYWLSCLLIDPDAMCGYTRTDHEYSYESEPGHTCPDEILDAIAALNAEGRPIWKPMHMQPIYKDNPFILGNTKDSVGEDIFARGLCLPSDNKMKPEEQDVIIDAVRRCFR